MEKIKMTTPLVEMDGDEMTRILWSLVDQVHELVELRSDDNLSAAVALLA